MRKISCGVIVTDGRRLLLGHATRSPRWDIPKGLAEAGESLVEAARRELSEETGLEVPVDALVALGVQSYLPRKDLALFTWRPERMPEPRLLACAAVFVTRDGATLPEFDRFDLFPWDDALMRVGKNMARLLAGVRPVISCPAISCPGIS